MFTTPCINVFDFFYPIGNTPAVSLTQSLPSKVAAKVLLLGCGDLRNILFTAHLDEILDRLLDITSCDAQKAVIARNILLLTLIIDDVDAKNDKSIWNIYYHMRIDTKSDDLLKAQASKLAELSATLHTWKQSKYGSQLKFCDTATLADVRTMWLFYSSRRTKAETSAINKRLDSEVNAAKVMKRLPEDGVVLTGLRAAAPAQVLALKDVDALHKRFWTQGTLDSTTGATAKKMLPNRMFLADNGTSTLHYGIDPLLGFHLATAYVPVESQSPSQSPGKAPDQLEKAIETARLQFKQWAASFRRRSGPTTLRFFAGDAIAFAHTLQHIRASDSATAGFYRNRYQFERLTLGESDYSATGSAPLTFDVVDTSNLCDHVGALNLLTAVSPLLNNNLASAMYTEVIPQSANSRKEIMDTMLCGDTPTVSTLLGLFPAEYWTNACCVSYGDEALFDVATEARPPSQQSGKSDMRQMFLRVAWKRAPCLASSGEADVNLLPIAFADKELAQVFYQIYVRMFEDEDRAKAFASLSLDPSMVLKKLDAQPQYHRASFAAFLHLVQQRVRCDWDNTMLLFIDLIEMRPHAPMGTIYFQELFAHLHVLNVYTVEAFEHPSLFSGMTTAGRNHLGSWKNIGPVVCVTLKVPRQYIKAFTNKDRLSFGSPVVHCKLSDGRWANLFLACQFSFGEVSTRGIRHSDGYEVSINEDQAGWNGNSALIVSFYTPSWGILQDYHSTSVSFGLHSAPSLIGKFAKHYGMELEIYETAIKNTDSVYITKYAPNQVVFPAVQGLTFGQATPRGDVVGKATQTLTANGDLQTGCIATMIGRLDINSKKLRAALQDGAPVTVANPTPCHSTVTVGEEQPLDLFFPVPVLVAKQKVRIARKSSFVEVISQVATVSSSAEFPTSFVYPLYLTGSKKIPLAWTMSHLDLEKQPSLILGDANKKVWLNSHFSMQMSSRERALREDKSIPRSRGERVRLDFKESLFSIFVQFSGLQGTKSDIFGISIPGKGGINILIFPHKLRIDQVTRTVVMDCAVLPLHTEIMHDLSTFIHSIVPRGVVQVIVDEAELSMWKQVLPSWVERCRTNWSHGDECEYRATGKIPLTDQHDEAQFLCSCGQGVFPGEFTLASVPGRLSMASKYSTRAAISPMFWAPFADEVYMPPKDDLENLKPSGRCNVCGAERRKDGKKLMRCGKCLLVEYCSAECQKKDWKAHKPVCSTVKA